MASNWRQTYEELKKRKKKVDNAKSTSEIKKIDTNYKNSLNNYSVNNYSTNKTSNLAPIKTIGGSTITPPTITPTTKKKEDKKWYQKIFTKGNFEDGYDFGDITKSILGTATDLTQDVTKGVISPLEDIVDIGANVVASGVDLFGGDKAAEKIRGFADKDLSENISNMTANVNPVGMLYNVVNGTPENIINPNGLDYDKDKSFVENYKEAFNKAYVDEPDTNQYEKSSFGGEYVDKVGELVGYTLALAFGGKALSKKTGTLSGGLKTKAGTTAIGGSLSGGNVGLTLGGKTLNIPTLALIGGGASGLQEANSKENVSEVERWSKFLSSGAIEGATEGIFGMFGVGGITNEAGKEVFDVAGSKAASLFKSSLAKTLANVGIRSTGESVEELLSYGANFLVDNGIIDKLGDADFSKDWDWAELGEQMALAFASSFIVQGGANLIENNSAIAEAEKQLGRKLTSSEKAQVTQASIEGTLETKYEQLQTQVQVDEEQQTTGVIEENQQEVQGGTQENTQTQPTEQDLENIDNQLLELETQLMKTTDDAQYEQIAEQIRALEEQANAIEQLLQQKEQGLPVYKVASTKQDTDIAPVQVANVEQTKQPTTQETQTNLTTEDDSNTPKVVKSQNVEQIAPKTKVNVANDTPNVAIEERQVVNNELTEDLQEESVNTQKIQGLENYNKNEIKSITNDYIKSKLEENDFYDIKIKGIEINGSRNRGDARQDSDLDIVVEYEGDIREDDLYNALNDVEERLEIDGIKVDINPITATKSGTLKEYIKRSKEYDKEKLRKKQQSKERKTPTQEELDNLEYIRKNKSGSEYASAYYDLEKKYGTGLFKGLNNYKSTGKAVEEEIAPVKEELADLKNEIKDTIKDTKKELKALTKELKEVKQSVSEVTEEFKTLTQEELPAFEQQAKESLNAITEDMIPLRNNLTAEETQELDILENIPFDTTIEEQERMRELQNEENLIGEENTNIEVESPLKDRNIEDVGNRKVKAYQYEHPEVRPYFQDAAVDMLYDLNNSTKGERIIIGDISQTGDGNFEYSGIKRNTTPDIADLLDNYHYTYAEIEKGLKAIIEDNGKENIAVAKRIEFALDDRLRNGYITVDGMPIPPNQDYINLLRGQEYSNYYNNIPIDENAPMENASNTEVLEENAPVNNQSLAIEPMEEFDNGGPMIKVSPKMKKKTLKKRVNLKNVDWDSIEDTSKGSQQQYNEETQTIQDTVEKKTKKQIKQELLAKTGILNVSLDNANKLPKVLMENTDPIRLQEMIFGRGLGTDINNMFFQKVKDNTSEKTRFLNKERAELKELGIKARSKESEAVQKYGEKQWVNERTGETFPYEDKDLANEFPDIETQNKIKNASKVIRQKYDSYLDRTNEVLTKLGYDPIPKRKDYMRHFQELNDIFSRVGIPYNYNEMTANDLPTDINGLTADFSPSKNFFASALRRTGNKTTYDAITGIDGYLEGVGNLIYHTEDIQRLRAFEQYIRDTYGENHGFDNLEELTNEEKVERIEKIQDHHLSNYASWLHEYTNTLAGKKALLDRSIESLVGRKIYSFLNTTKTQVGRNMIGFNISSALTGIIPGVQTLAKTNKLAATKGLADTVKNVFINDGFVEKNNFLTSRFGSDRLSKTLWGRIGDAGFVFMRGVDHFMANFVVRSKYNELKAKGYTDAQAHIEAGKYASRLMSDRSQGATPNIYNSQMLGLVTQFQNEVNNQLYSMFYDTYHESREKAQGNALKTATGMTFTLGQLAVFTHLFGAGFEKLAGYNPTFDIIGVLMKAFGLDDDEDEDDTTMENITQAFDQLVDGLPYVNILTGGGRIPVSEAFTGVTDTFKALTGGKDEYGQDVEWSDAWGSIKESAPYFLLPTGYGQLKKTTKGLGMYDEDLPIAGSYTDSGNLRFTAEEDTWSKLQAGIFGQWANEEAQKYVDSDFKTINKDNIDELIELGMTSSEYRNYRTGLSGKKSNEEKIEYINSLDVTDEQKNIMANNILDRDYDVDMSNYDEYSSYEEFDFYYKNQEKYNWLQSNGISYSEYAYDDESKELYNYAYKYPETYKLGKAITGDFKTYKEYADYIWDLKADKDENGDSISGTKKAKVIDYVRNLDLSIPQKAMLIRKTYSSFDDYNFEIVDYVVGLDLSYEDKKTILEELDMTLEDDGTVRWD